MKGLILFILTLCITFFGFVYAVDKSMDNKDIMLCNSAKRTSNEHYLNKCKCFYAGENITCIYK